MLPNVPRPQSKGDSQRMQVESRQVSPTNPGYHDEQRGGCCCELQITMSEPALVPRFPERTLGKQLNGKLLWRFFLSFLSTKWPRMCALDIWTPWAKQLGRPSGSGRQPRVAFSSVISALEKSREWQTALELFSDTRGCGQGVGGRAFRPRAMQLIILRGDVHAF